jgi:HAD superfamily hydrolase (TIGR01509 family)
VRGEQREPPAGVIFDMDGVLVDSGAHHRAAWRALLDELAERPASPDYWRLTIGRPAEEAVGRLLGRPLTAAEARRLARRKHDHYARLAGTGLPAIRGAPAFVRALSTHRVPCGVATSASRFDAERLLEAIGLRSCFGCLVAADDVWQGKPEPEVYLTAAERLGVDPARCLVFEDALVGIVAARRAGMRVIGLTTAHTEAELTAAGAERVVADFEGLAWPV